jgi:lysozyme family protein
MTPFETAVAFTLREEGSFSDRASDEGGATKYGIARRYHPDITDAQWGSFSVEDATALYRIRYWLAIKADNMPGPVGLALFDTAVNLGVGPTLRMLQRLLGVEQDGKIGPQTIAACWTIQAPILAERLLTERVLRYSADEDWEENKRGWTGRCFRAYRAALAVLA